MPLSVFQSSFWENAIVGDVRGADLGYVEGVGDGAVEGYQVVS